MDFAVLAYIVIIPICSGFSAHMELYLLQYNELTSHFQIGKAKNKLCCILLLNYIYVIRQASNKTCTQLTSSLFHITGTNVSHTNSGTNELKIQQKTARAKKCHLVCLLNVTACAQVAVRTHWVCCSSVSLSACSMFSSACSLRKCWWNFQCCQ